MTLESFISQVKAREAKTTQGPWALDSMGMFVFGPDMEMIASEGIIGAEYGNTIIRGAGRGLPMASNADFIAHARTDIPTLVRLVEVLTEETQHRSWCNVHTSWVESCDCDIRAAITAALSEVKP